MAELDYDALREAAETALEAGRQHSFIVPTSLYRFHDAFTPSVGVALLDRVWELEAEVFKQRRKFDSMAFFSDDHAKRARSAEAERDAALSTIAKVEALHVNVFGERFSPVCAECTRINRYGQVAYPCPTIRALGSVPSTGEGNDALD